MRSQPKTRAVEGAGGVNLKQALERASEIFADNGVEYASLEGEILIRHVLGLNRAQLYSDLNRELNPIDDEVFRGMVARRAHGEPSAYITGHREFYGLDFYVDRNVLIPRPESELLVEKTIDLARSRTVATIAEVGTGCGAIAISLAYNLPETKIYATDISVPALEIARSNCLKHGVADRVRLLKGDMFDPLPEPVDMIVANLPYVREDELSSGSPLSFEPTLALDGGADGLANIGRMCRQADARLLPGGCLLLEIGQGQAKTVVALLHEVFPTAQIEVSPDLSGIERVVNMCLTQE